MLARSIRRPSPVVSPADFFPFDPCACAHHRRSPLSDSEREAAVGGGYTPPPGEAGSCERASERANERASARGNSNDDGGEAKRGEVRVDAARRGKQRGKGVVRLYYSRALLPYPRRSSQKLGAARDRQYQFWNAPTSTEIHKRDLGISRENVGPRGSIDLSKNIRRARLNVFMYITSGEGRRARGRGIEGWRERGDALRADDAKRAGG